MIMKKLSLKLLSDTVEIRRKEKKITQSELSKLTGINRALLSRLESQTFTPSVDQLLALAQILDININDLFTQTDDTDQSLDEPVKIAVAGTGYVGLSLAVLLAQHNDVTAVDIVPEKVEKIQNYISPIQDEYISRNIFRKPKTVKESCPCMQRRTVLPHMQRRILSSLPLRRIMIQN